LVHSTREKNAIKCFSKGSEERKCCNDSKEKKKGEGEGTRWTNRLTSGVKEGCSKSSWGTGKKKTVFRKSRTGGRKDKKKASASNIEKKNITSFHEKEHDLRE